MEQAAASPTIERTLAMAAQGDGQSWRALVDAYAGRVFGLIVGQCGDRDLADEITQATFVKVVAHIGRYREQGRFESWLFRIAMNQLRDEMRRRRRHARGVGQAPSDDGEAGDSAGSSAQALDLAADDPQRTDPLAHLTRAEQAQRVRDAVRKLGPADREIVHLRHTAGLSFAQIAQTLDQPLGTVLARGHRALKKLRVLLREEMEQ